MEANMIWNIETTEFQMRGVAYSGNNMRKLLSSQFDQLLPVNRGMKLIYHTYHSTKKVDKTRVRTSNVPRPYCMLQPKGVRQSIKIH